MWSGNANPVLSPGRPSKSLASSFVDVPADSPFALAIAWMERVGITQGCNPPANTIYCPTADTTRGQMAAFFTRALSLPPAGDQGFIDIANSVFVNAINSIALEGITLGCNPPANDRYCPDDITSRGQMAGFFTTGSQPSPGRRPGVHRHSQFGVRQRHQLDSRRGDHPWLQPACEHQLLP